MREEHAVEDDGHDLPQQLRRDDVAAPRDHDVEDEGIDDPDDEDDQRDPAEEVQRVGDRLADVATSPNISGFLRKVAEREKGAERNRAEDQRDEVRQNLAARSHLLGLPLPPLRGEVQDVFDADEKVDDAEAGDEAAHERIAREQQQIAATPGASDSCSRPASTARR